jgi:hypothetical protein
LAGPVEFASFVTVSPGKITKVVIVEGKKIMM